MAKWNLIHDIVKNLYGDWEVDASSPQDSGTYVGLASGPHGMRLFFKARTERLHPSLKHSCPPLGWLRVDGRLAFSDEDLSAKLSLMLRNSMTAKEMANEISTYLLPIYADFLDVIEKHNSTTRPTQESSSMRYGEDYRRLFDQRAGVAVLRAIADPQHRLVDGDNAAQFLEPVLRKFLTSFNLSSAPPSEKPRLERSAERLVFYGLRTHCLLYGSEYRGRHNERMDRGELYESWLVKSLTASSQLRGYNKDNQGVPMWIFNTVFDSEVEPIQKELRLGWWRRLKNRTKFLNLFDSGILLVMLYDIKSKVLSDQLRISPQPANDQSLQEIADEDIPF